ncbi:uncharacterized protein LOC117326313 isoform X1 [Pecten maximus]|uniref:uncharacterized protein LOC117326313 isoform X1 n=1 Tax=Pecten maximus TaxID=6579 RepID=UPI00145851D5|nr:uncharacterized protein LOC117326313 isoform X1 [Pecten maximus]
MPLIERQLRHWFTSSCQRCEGWTDPSQYLCDVRLSEFNPEGGLQEALRSAFSRPNSMCSRQRCGGRANTRVEFELGNPPMFLAINLYRIDHLIPNSGSINFTEVVELFGERYMIFLFTLAQPDARENGSFIPGHNMSYVFRPERGGEFGRDGRPVGNWFFYPNNLHGDMEPWTPGQADPAGTNPSYIYLIRIPPSSSGGATSGQEEEGPTRMAGTVPLASDNVISETKDDRMENQVHEGVVESSPQREGEVVNSSPQPDGGVVEPCPQREGVARPGSDKVDQSLLEISQPTSVNGTSNKESYMDIMLWQKRSHSPINHQGVIRISSNNWMTSSTDMGPDSDEAITSRPPENRPQGVPHGGRVYLRNTCSLDQFLNGLYQVCRFTPIRNQLEKLVRRFPDAYELLWRALLLCEEERFPEAKHVLVPRLNMYSNEYLQIRTLLEGQLHHWFTSLCCECEDWISISQNLTEILLNEFNPEGGLQEALRSICSLPNGTCNQPGCGSRTNIRVEFELGNPPMFLAIHLRHLISNSGSINFTEVVELFGERYFLFLFTMIRPPSSEGELGHFMSYVFRPDGGTEMGTDGRPVGAWYWFPNDFDGTLERRTPGQEDPEGTFPVTAYLVQIPPSSSGEATSDQEEEGPIQKGDDNKE